MVKTWLQKKCVKCGGGEVFYLPHWKVSPKHCGRCRLLEVDDLKGLFEKFLDRESKLRTRCRTTEDKQIFAEREALRAKVQNSLRVGASTPNRLSDICERDKELARLAFRLIKEHSQRRHSRGGGKNIVLKSPARVFQGGAPGLGKRS